MDDAIIEKIVKEELSAVTAQILEKVKLLQTDADEYLDKFIISKNADGKENEMKKIRRPVRIGNEVQWITASTEQEYAEKLIMLVSGTNALSPQEAKGTPFREFLLQWYSVTCSVSTVGILLSFGAGQSISCYCFAFSV